MIILITLTYFQVIYLSFFSLFIACILSNIYIYIYILFKIMCFLLRVVTISFYLLTFLSCGLC